VCESDVRSGSARTDSVKFKRTGSYDSFGYDLDYTGCGVCMLCVQQEIERCVVYLMSIISLSHSQPQLKIAWSCRFSKGNRWSVL